MADLMKLFFEDKARVTDREVLATARLNACVRAFMGQGITEDTVTRINQAVADESAKLVAEGILPKPPDWLATLVGRRLWVAFGTDAVIQLSKELKQRGLV